MAIFLSKSTKKLLKMWGDVLLLYQFGDKCHSIICNKLSVYCRKYSISCYFIADYNFIPYNKTALNSYI